MGDTTADEKKKELEERLSRIKSVQGWNSQIEENVKKIGEKAIAYNWMHTKSASRYSDRNGVFQLINLTLSTVVGLSIFTSASSGCGDGVKWVQYVIGFVQFITTLSSVITNNLNYGVLSTQHKRAAGEWQELHQNILRQLSLNRRDRQYAKDYTQWIDREFRSLFVKSPDISHSVEKSFEKVHKNNKIVKIFDIANEIKIRKHTDQSSHTSSNHNRTEQANVLVETEITTDGSKQPIDPKVEKAVNTHVAIEMEKYRQEEDSMSEGSSDESVHMHAHEDARMAWELERYEE